jgi:hypothetical protein
VTSADTAQEPELRWRVVSARMAADYVTPARNLEAFHCPHCGTFAHQLWADAMANFGGQGFRALEPQMVIALCSRCRDMSLWADDRMIFPRALVAPGPHDDLAEPALSTYREAREVVSASPRAAAALLRLCVQQLVPLLGGKSNDLNAAVGELVAVGLPVLVQQSMDSVRLIGNEAVHPGTIDLNDDPQMAMALFDLVNLVVQTMVTQPRMVKDLYGRLPPTKLEAIERRDKT